jgi:hypothetical protein
MVTDIQNTRPLQIKKTGKVAQADTSDGLAFALTCVLNKASKTRQSRGHIHDDKTSAIETEARNHEDEEMSVADEPGVFQVTKNYVHNNIVIIFFNARCWYASFRNVMSVMG